MKRIHTLSIAGLAIAVVGLGVGVQIITSEDERSLSHFASEEVTDSTVNTSPLRGFDPDTQAWLEDSEVVSGSTDVQWKRELPTQFSDTDVTGSLHVDEQGNFVPDTFARQVFDYFLTAQDDASIEQITAWLTAYINENLESPANEQALVVLKNYMDYKIQLNELTVDQDVWARLYDPYQLVTQADLKSLAQVFSQRQGLQSQLFDQDTQQSLFAEENQYDNYMLQRLQVSLSNQSQQEINQQLAELESQQSPESLATRQASQIALKHRDLGDSLNEADNATKYQVYSQTYGDEAANRLMALQEKRQAFSQKRDQYLAYKESLSSSNASDALNDYMKYELSLSDGEIQRMYMLDKLDASKMN